MLVEKAAALLQTCRASCINSSRSIARIPHYEYHIRFDPKVGRKRPAQDVLDRFKRLNNGMWIRPHAGRNKKRYQKDEVFAKTSYYYETCTKEECEMLDKMMTPFWLRQKHYVDDPYEPYQVRHGIDSPRVDYKGRLVREHDALFRVDSTFNYNFDFYSASRNAIAFLHPYCEQGGGGEVVLWKAVEALREQIKKKNECCSIYIYTTVMDATTLEKAKKSIRERFGFDMNAKENVDAVQFVHIKTRTLLEPKWYPRFTLFGQFLGGVIVSLECLLRLNPTLMIESTGIPGALPVFKLIGGSKVLVYMHYPTITTNMIQRVNSREEMYNNAAFIARNPWLSALKSYYYLLFSYIYRLCGHCAEKVLVNGTFTKRHIEELWPTANVKLCYPPADLEKFFELKSKAEQLFEQSNTVKILSLGQFRPEKNHSCQLETLSLLKKKDGSIKYCLNMLGGVRNADDQKVVDDLREYADKLKLVEGTDFNFVCNAPMERLTELLTESIFGIHTMIDEHFGIALVEMLAAGIIVVAHESGGPLFDIIAEKRGVAGFLGKKAEDYANTIAEVMQKSKEQRDAIRAAASKKANEFSEQSFKNSITNEAINLITLTKMKLYSIMIFYKDNDTGTAKILKSASELSSFSFFYKKNVGEFMQFTGRLLADRAKVPSRQTITEQEYRLRCFVRPDNLTGVCVTDQEYEDRVSFTMLSKILEEFAQAVPAASWPTLTEKNCNFNRLPELIAKWQNPREADALMRVQDEVEETKVVLHNTMQSVLDRGERLDDLVRASENLSDQSKMFYTQARKMNKCCSYV